jgi:hypothetical protein
VRWGGFGVTAIPVYSGLKFALQLLRVYSLWRFGFDPRSVDVRVMVDKGAV